MLFSELWLKNGLLRSLESVGYVQATPIQAQVMKLALRGKNIVWQSQTWTGKTAAFLLPVLNNIDTNKKSLQALILAPTRELVTQIGDEIRWLTEYYGVTYACLYGWASPNVQKKQLSKKPAIVIATPGRLMDFMNQKVIDVRLAEYFILDEVDRMLDMWFVRDIRKIRSQLRNVRQTFTFSATMNDDMKAIIKEHVSSYEFIKIGDAITVDKINHRYMPTEHEHKLHNLIELIRSHSKDKIIVFTHTKRNTKTIQGILVAEKINAGVLNGNMSQGKRQSTLDEFKKWTIQVLVTTDVAARWLNMENVGLVVNFDVPADAKSYIHRIGRTGRAGAHGKAIMLVSPMEHKLLQDIEKEHKIKIQQTALPSRTDGKGVYDSVRLNRSTDKAWGWRWGRPNKPARWWNRSRNSGPKNYSRWWQWSDRWKSRRYTWVSNGPKQRSAKNPQRGRPASGWRKWWHRSWRRR